MKTCHRGHEQSEQNVWIVVDSCGISHSRCGACDLLRSRLRRLRARIESLKTEEFKLLKRMGSVRAYQFKKCTADEK